MILMLTSSMFHQQLTKHLHLLSHQHTQPFWESTIVYQHNHHRLSYTIYCRIWAQAHTSTVVIFLSPLLKVNDSLTSILPSSTLEIATNSLSVELKTPDTTLIHPLILYIHMSQTNNTEPHAVLLELDTKFNIIRHFLLRIKQSYYDSCIPSWYWS